jgi:hypothetical protein
MINVKIDSFQCGPDVKATTAYQEVKDAALKVGHFSCFEASASPRAAQLYNALCRDPEIELFEIGYPWRGIRRKEPNA